MLGGRWWLQQLSEQQHRDHLVGMTATVRVLAAVLVRPPLSRTDAAERRSCGPDCIDGLMLAAHDTSVVQRLVFATDRSVQDAWRLDPCVRGEVCTYICGSGSGAAAVAIAVARSTSIASRSIQCSEER